MKTINAALSLLQLVAAEPELQTHFEFEGLVTYIDLVLLLKPCLLFIQPLSSTPPHTLPVNIHNFLKASLHLPDEVGKLAWERFQGIIWEMDTLSEGDEKALRLKYARLFIQFGLAHGIGVYNLEPPTHFCINPGCSHTRRGNEQVLLRRELRLPVVHEITVFTKDLGAVPGFATSRYCRNCQTRYHHNYYVHSDASMRTYYKQVPGVVQTSQHYYMTEDVLQLFRTMMLTSWTSFTNCARIYNEGLAKNIPDITTLLPLTWPISLKLNVDQVSDGFFIYALIIDHQERDDILQLSHNDVHRERLNPALQARNHRMVGPGQEAWNHACDACCWVYEEDGTHKYVRSTVTDGITIGHPCCAGELDCKNPLPTTKHRFCREHQDKEKKCSVIGCDMDARTGHRTCQDPAHKKIEDHLQMRGKAMFQLKRRLERLHASQTHDSLSTGASEASDDLEGAAVELDEDFDLQDDGLCDGKSDTGNRKPKARFGRKWTHNEQLCVGSCGVILGRATFYGSEAPNGVRAFWMKLFPTKASLPQVLWHDNNCRIMAMLQKDTDPAMRNYFNDCALPVDVFHFKCKHKESDTNCNQFCNPANWKELEVSPGVWRFNSSAAEQTNVWMGGYQSIVREMTAIRYNFFLDEMIKWRNRMLIQELGAKGKAPYSIPRHVLLKPDN